MEQSMKPVVKTGLILAASCLLAGCSGRTEQPVDVGFGYESHALYAPWDKLEDDTRFSCHSTQERFFFSFEVCDTTVTLSQPFLSERDVEPEDRVEIFLSPKGDLSQPYYCAEIDPEGRVMDYRAAFFRQFDFSWQFETLVTSATRTSSGYRVGGSIARKELEQLGLDLAGGFWMGAFRADFRPDGTVHWFSRIPTDDAVPDFHKPGVLFPCRMNPAPEKRGVVVYPDDITSVGLKEWENRIRKGGLQVVALHAATNNDPVDTLEAFVTGPAGQAFLALCRKMQVDVEYELHAVETLLPRDLFEKHPEYFREDEAGCRRPDYNMCFSSEEAVEAMRPQIARLLAWMKPTTHRYYFWTDDKTGKFCHCVRCRPYSPSEQALLYENRLLGLLREYDPEATLAHLAYHQTLEAPVKVRAAEGIFLEFAPIGRDYAQPLPEKARQALEANLLAFPGHSFHVLEYWLDESMFSRWKKQALVPLPFEREQCTRDIRGYRDLGARDFTTFATWLNAGYIRTYGPVLPLFEAYSASFNLINNKR